MTSESTQSSTVYPLEPLQPLELNRYAAAVGIDWADQKHDVALLPEPATPGQHVEQTLIDAAPQGLMAWVTSLQKRFKDRPIAVAVEQRRGPLIHFLSAFDFIDIFPIPTATLKKLREAFYPSGRKSDIDDSLLALEVLTKHGNHLRPLRPESPEIRELALLCEDRRHCVDQRTALMQALRDACKSYFPLVVDLFDFKTPLVCHFLERWLTLEQLQKAKQQTLRKFFYAHRCRGDVVERRLAAIKEAVGLTTDPGVVNPMSMRVEALCQQLLPLFDIVNRYEQRIATIFEQLPTAQIIQSLPGAGKTMAPRLAAALGEDRSKFQDASDLQNYSGTSPVSRMSGKSQREVLFRRGAPTFQRQTFVEWAHHSRRKCQWAEAFYALCRERGDAHNTALRKLAWKWQRIVFRLWKNRECYDDEKYLRSLTRAGSPIAKKISEMEAVPA